MLGFLRTLFGFFSPYADARERRVGIFLKRLDSGSSRWDAAATLRKIISRDLLRLTILLEWKLKGYRKLASKSYRRNLYANADTIAQKFTEWFLGHQKELSAQRPGADDRELWIRGIMTWLAPENGIFQYEAGAAFERALRDPSREKIVADCNQISTLYTWLWSLRFPVTELDAKFPPNHACLRILNRDIECTAGKFTDYSNVPTSPIEELCAVNVLDVSDSKLRIHRPSPLQMERAATFAFLFSSRQEITENNLRIAWKKLAHQALQEKDWQAAWDWFGKLNDQPARQETAHLAALALASAGKFSRAEEWAAHSGLPEVRKAVLRARALAAYYAKNWTEARKWYERAGEPESIKIVFHAQATEAYHSQKWAEARKWYERAQESELVKNVWLAEYSQLQEKVKNCRTDAQWKAVLPFVRRMRECAREGGNRAAQESCDRILETLG